MKIALKNNPNFVCLVPEKRKEITTEGGLNLINLRAAREDFQGYPELIGITCSTVFQLIFWYYKEAVILSLYPKLVDRSLLI